MNMWKDLLERAKKYAKELIMDKLKGWFVTPGEVQAVNDDPFPNVKAPDRRKDEDVTQ